MHSELSRLISALQEFYARERFILERDLGERTLTHRLAVQIERHFPGWDVDCDYNRFGDRAMLLPRGSIVSTDDPLGKSVYPDIVVHRRSIPQHLLAVEVRKAANHQPLQHDLHKLMALTDPHLWFAFAGGVLLTLGRTRMAGAEVYVGGQREAELSAWFAARL
ncbi:MAG: hypothetical protein WA702_03085 [Bradyrhizobium sp.]|jgi:hypothetical protein|uniref:hypothetical protein n=1 Tax=Bradyrhizobium sp. TaxID=376 RepID=UPI003C7B0249